MSGRSKAFGNADAATKPEIKEGYLIDYISGKQVKDGPEERDAVQVFSRMLVEDYGYPKTHIQTRPQYRVKVRPSDTKKQYPVDIAVFGDATKADDDIYIVVECKKKNRKDGRTQLEDYLRFCKAGLGVWFNGHEHLFLKKIEKGGKVLFEEIPNIPLYGQRVEDVGLFKRKDLKPATNLKAVFKTMRNFLAANAVGITRDEVFAQQLINLIFCKIYDERFTKPDSMVTFRAGVDEEPKDVKARITTLFDLVKDKYNDVIDKADSIQFDPVSLTHIVGSLQQYALTASDRDAVGEAFETFIGPALKGPQGQFFTPRNVVKMVVDMVDPQADEKIIDPACVSGGVLVEGLRHVWRKVEERGATLGWPEREIDADKQKLAIANFRGIDKGGFLSKVAKSYMAILGDGRGGVYCENSVENPRNWNRKTREAYAAGQDVRENDILLVRDGTYLVGSSCIITSQDVKSLYCGGLFKFRVQDDALDPFLLLGLLNSFIVKRQIRARQFTRDVIDTLGNRIEEVVLPIPKNAELRKAISDAVKNVVEKRVSARDTIAALAIAIAPDAEPVA